MDKYLIKQEDTIDKSMKGDTLIQTDKSFLTIYPFSDQELLKNSIEEIIKYLIVYPKIKVYGKDCIQHRRIAFFSDDSIGYRYSGQIAKSIPLTDDFKKIINIINTRFSSQFNGILVNHYIDGNDYIGQHSDDESNLDKTGVISISLGAIRNFRIYDKKTKKKVMDIPTESSYIIHMGGEFQKEFTHGIPIEKKIKEGRISLTLRKHLK